MWWFAPLALGYVSGVFSVLVLLRDPPQDGEQKGKRTVPPW